MVSTPAAVKDIFLAALDKATPQERAAYLEAACGGDEALRREVEVLLAAHDQPDSRLDQPAHIVKPSLDATSLSDNSIHIGTMVGPYKLLQVIGEGGMGIVYMAEQREPVERKVALKIIKPGMDSRQVIARFEAERQALALMDHQNIAKVFEAGTTESGRPYFVMELVKGIPITKYCDEKHLSLKQRLELMIPVCQAIQHAHQKGIIHRDIKPTNVLIAQYDGRPVPKVIDFGVAKATAQKLTERTMFTELGQIVGTLEYMSPEQAELNQLDIDTRSDIYSLGVLLYELLTGSTPFDKQKLRTAAFHEMLRIIREDEPPKPSTNLSTSGTLPSIAANRQTEPARLSRAVRGELDWIVMKALEKDRNRRYESANGFAADIQRYLSDEQVQACPPSAAYRLSKFARRHNAALTTAALITAALVMGTIVSAWQAVRATSAEIQAKTNEAHALAAASAERAAKQAEAAERVRAEASEAKARVEEQKARAAAADERRAKEQETDQRKRAEAAEADTQTFADFLVNNVLAAPRPTGVQFGQGISVTVAAALDAAEPKVEKTFAGRPKAEAIARDALGKTWRNLADFARAEAHLRRALEIRQRELGPDHRETLESANSLAVCLEQMGRYPESITIQEHTVELSKAKRGPNDGTTLLFMKNLAGIYQKSGRFNDAANLCEATHDLAKAKLGPDHPTTLTSAAKLAEMYEALGRLDEAVPLMEKTLELYKRKLGTEHPETLVTMHNLGHMYLAAGKTDLALSLLEQSLRLNRTTFGVDHPNTGAAMNSVGRAYKDAGKLELALPLFEEALKLAKAKLGPDHPSTLATMHNLASAYQEAGKPDLALPLFEETHKLKKAKLGPEHVDTLTTMHYLGRAYRAVGRIDQALPISEETVKVQKAKLGPDHPDTLATMHNLAAVYLDAGKLDQALPLFEETLKLKKAKLGPDHPETLTTMNNLGSAYQAAGKPDQALPLFEETLKLRKAKLGPEHPETLTDMNELGKAYWDTGRAPQAVELGEELLSMAKTKLGPDHPFTLNWMNNLALWYESAGKPDLGMLLMQDALSVKTVKLGKDHPQTLLSLSNLAFMYDRSAEFSRAEALFREAIPLFQAKLGPERRETLLTMSSFGLNLLHQRKYAEAESLLRQCLEISERSQPDYWETFNTKSRLGGALVGQAQDAKPSDQNAAEEKFAEAEPLLLAGYDVLKARDAKIPAPKKKNLTEALQRLVELYTAWNKPDEAARWQKELEARTSAKEK